MPLLRKSPPALAQQIFVEGDMLVFGFGGFYERPKGFGLDICYFHKDEFSHFRSRKPLMGRIRNAMDERLRDRRMVEEFIPQLMSRWRRLLTHEWHYDRAELMFQSVKTLVPSMKKYDDFQSFARQNLMGGKAFLTPLELEAEMLGYMERVVRQDGNAAAFTQQYLLFNYLERAIEKDMLEMFGQRQGEWLFRELRASCESDPALSEGLDDFMRVLFLNPKALNLLANWHVDYFSRQRADQERIGQSLKRLKVKRSAAPTSRRARRDILKGFTALPAELPTLLHAMNVPIFVATGENLFFFRGFHEPGFLVHREDGQMHQMISLGLCKYRRYQQGGVFITWGGRLPERVWHTQAEECTHFADGPTDRWTQKGEHRYSSDSRFHTAYQEDLSRYPTWQHARQLTAREWGHILLQMKVGEKARAKVQARIEAYQAELDFLHYDESDRMAETFAALPIIEKAAGAALARRVLPAMFAFYDTVYKAGLRAEATAVTRN